jgi:prepilin-type N-terminal cleavage/methylation domain-containing protein
MNYKLRKRGFSLTEVLLAVGILAVGMLFIAGTFLVGIHFSIIATEQTIAAVAADEAFAKIKIYGVNVGGLSTNQQTPFTSIDPNEFAYPSTSTVAEKQYYWSALCRRVGPDPNWLVQVTVFVCRKVGSGSARPVPVKVYIKKVSNNELEITDANETLINDGYTIVDNQTGQIYRVVERHVDNPSTPTIREDHIILLDRPWEGVSPGLVWVVPPPISGGRYPCIAVYPTEIRF